MLRGEMILVIKNYLGPGPQWCGVRGSWLLNHYLGPGPQWCGVRGSWLLNQYLGPGPQWWVGRGSWLVKPLPGTQMVSGARILVIKPLPGTRTNGQPLSPAGKRLDHKLPLPYLRTNHRGNPPRMFTRQRVLEEKNVSVKSLFIEYIQVYKDQRW